MILQTLLDAVFSRAELLLFDIYTSQGTVPEPGTWLLMATAIGVAGISRSLRIKGSGR